MNYSYHNHTVRCNHATGTMEEYVLRARACGVKYFGFSEHAPYLQDDGAESWYRIPLRDAKTYVEEVHALRDKYRNEMEILAGFEMEYYRGEFPKMLAQALSAGAEYLILGAHYLYPEALGCRHTMKETDEDTAPVEYADLVIEAMETGLFTYLAHPDVQNFVGDPEIYLREARRLCEAGRELNIPFELNLLGIRSRRHYPNSEFWRIAGEVGVPVTFGMDAHDVYNAYDDKSLPVAKKMVEEFGLNYIGKPEIVRI